MGFVVRAEVGQTKELARLSALKQTKKASTIRPFNFDIEESAPEKVYTDPAVKNKILPNAIAMAKSRKTNVHNL